MLCDRDDFLLIIEQWLTDSASVLLILTLFDDPTSPFLGIQMHGVIASIDRTLPGFCFRSREGDAIENFVVHLEDWNIGYADRSAFAKAPNPINPDVRESFGLNKPGISMSISALIDP
jgi:hypothetical protein